MQYGAIHLFICELQKWNHKVPLLTNTTHSKWRRRAPSLSHLTHLLHPVLWCVSPRLDRALKFDSLIGENIYSAHTHTHRKRHVSTAHTKACFWRGSERKSKGCLPPTDTGWRRLSRRRGGGGGCESQNLFKVLVNLVSLLASWWAYSLVVSQHSAGGLYFPPHSCTEITWFL